MTIWSTDPVADLVYECAVLTLAGCLLLIRPAPCSWRFGLALCALPLLGFSQLALGATVYRYATLQSSLRLAALSATAWIAYTALGAGSSPRRCLEALAWFGFLLSIVSVLAYYTSPGQVLWLIEVRYPDVWGPFLSRNNFAQFLELTLPVALWLAFHRPEPLLYWGMSAVMLAAGFVSASRAGALVLTLEALAVFLVAERRHPKGQRKWVAAFLAGVLILAALAGAGTLVARFSSSPFDERPQIYRSALAMIAERPWEGYGLGTFHTVYPEFALFDSGYTIDHAHNDWLEWTSEGGIAFTAMWGVLFFPMLTKVRHHFWGLGVPAALLHALVDFPMARLGIAAWVFLLLGAMERMPQPPLDRRTT